MKSTIQGYQRFISIDLTKKCNNNCIFCVVDGRKSEAADQSLEDISVFLKEHRNSGFTTVNLHGGEPTLFKKIKDVIQVINENGYKEIIIQTNGYKLEDKDFVNYLLKNNVKLFVVSFHDCIEESHNHLTKSKKSFKQAVNGIRNVIELGGEVRTNTVILKDNYKRTTEIIKFLYGLNVKRFNISSLNPYWLWATNKHDIYNQLNISYKEVSKYLSEAINFCKEKDDILLTLEGFPYCVIDNSEPYNLYSIKRDISLLADMKSIINYEEFLNNEGIRHKHPKCNDCTMNYTCKGVWKGYTKYSGWDEFNPIKNN